MNDVDPIEMPRALKPELESEVEIQRSTERILARLIEEGLVDPSMPPPSRWRRITWRYPWVAAAAMAAICALLVTSAVLTPTGSAVANWVGELIGVGEPGGPPTLDRGPTPQHRDPGAANDKAGSTVLGVVRILGRRGEVTISRTASGAVCFSLEIPADAHRLTTCRNWRRRDPADGRGSPVSIEGASSRIPSLPGWSLIVGRAPAGLRSLQIGLPRNGEAGTPVNRWSVDAALVDPAPAIREVTGFPGADLYFAAAIPGAPSHISVVATDPAGRRAAYRSLPTRVADTISGGVIAADPKKQAK